MRQPPSGEVSIGSLATLQKKGQIKFAFREDGIQREGFAAWHQGAVVAYENRCRHLPVSLDYGDSEFFTPDKQYFQCRTHGATYHPETGECVRGPCIGATLRKLRVVEREGLLYLVLANQPD